MSGPTDDAQPPTVDEVAPRLAEPPPPPASVVEAPGDTEDVEVVVHPPEPEPLPLPHTQPHARHDSVSPTSRKLAPPPKPKRDSTNPGSLPPPDQHVAGLAGNESLRAIGDALAKDAGAFSASETPTGARGVEQRGRPQPRSAAPSGSAATARAPHDAADAPSSRDKVPTVPDASASPTAPAPKLPSIRAQRIIAVGTPSDRPTGGSARPSTGPSRPPELERTLESALPTPHVPTAQPPLVAPVIPRAPSVPNNLPVPSVGAGPPRPSVSALAAVAPPAPPTPPPEAHVEREGPEISVTASSLADELGEDEVTSPHASPAPLEVAPPALLAALTIPAEPTPAPPPFAPSRPAAAAAPEPEQPPAVEPPGPDSADRMALEELSREDSPSIPPEEPPPVVPPPAPSARAEAKPPPPPPKRAPTPSAAEAAASEGEKRKAKQKRPWWEELFSEDFVRANWKVSDEQIKREVTFVEESLGVAPGGVVLDLGCGPGQHAVELASRGYGVVGYDLSLYQLALAADIAQERSQKINFLQGDMREMAFEEMFDGIFCWNTSFGYFEEDKNFSVAERAFRALRPGGMFLVDVINRDFVAAHTPSSVWFEGDSCVCMDDAVIDYFTSRLRVKRSVILDDGRTRECTYSVRLYSFHELGKLLHEVGFRVTEVSGHPATPGVFLGQASPRILMLAQRP